MALLFPFVAMLFFYACARTDRSHTYISRIVTALFCCNYAMVWCDWKGDEWKTEEGKKPAPNQLGHVYFVILVTFSGFRFNPLLFAITSFYHFSACFSISHSYIDALCWYSSHFCSKIYSKSTIAATKTTPQKWWKSSGRHVQFRKILFSFRTKTLNM